MPKQRRLAVETIGSSVGLYAFSSVQVAAMYGTAPVLGTSVNCVDSNLEVPNAAQLLRAIAFAVRGARCGWAPVPRLCAILTVSRRTLICAVQRNSWWCTHINGYVIAKNQEVIFADIPAKITDVVRNRLG